MYFLKKCAFTAAPSALSPPAPFSSKSGAAELRLSLRLAHN